MKKSRFCIVFLLCAALCVTASSLNVMKEDFDSYFAGTDPLEVEEMYGYFEWHNATNESSIELVEDNGGTAMKLAGYSELYTIDYIPAEYVFSLRIKPKKDNGMVNVFVRGDMPGGLVKQNPRNAGIMQSFYYFEWDWYAENGGSHGGSSVGGSGLAISLTKNGFTMRIKKYVPDSLTITSSVFNVKANLGIDLNAYNDVKITDTGKRIDVFINGVLGGFVELSDESMVYESDGTNTAYYKKATVYDGDGKLLGEVEDTRLHYNGSQIAVAGRNETFYVDDICIACGEHAIEYSNGEYTPEPPQTATDTENRDTDPATAPEETDPVTDGTSDETTEPADTEEAKPSGGAGKKTKIIIIAAAVDAVIIAAMAVFIPKKKK